VRVRGRRGDGDNLKALAAGGGHYIVCMPVKVGSEVATQVVNRAGRYRTVAPNLRVKEVTVGEGERRRRYAVCFNPDEAKRQEAHREQVLAELEAELASLAAVEPGKGTASAGVSCAPVSVTADT